MTFHRSSTSAASGDHPSVRGYTRLRIHLVSVARRRQEITALHAAGNGNPGQAQHRRRDIDDADGLAMIAGGDARAGDDERDAQRTVVEQHPVRALAVLAEALAVVAEDRR